ncbi:MAG: ribulose-phosphate 3-epimerase [Acholeplasmatales bacterium]
MKVAVSILTADFNNLEKEIKSLHESDYIHLDVMDGHFVPNISFGKAVLQNIKNITNVPLDTHLMITNPYDYIDDFAEIGSKYITIHIEANKVLETLEKIRSHNIKTGLSLRPKTDIKLLDPYLKDLDLVLVMTVEPGFGGQSFMIEQMKKVEYLYEMRKKHNYKYVIEIDGGVNDKTIKYAKLVDIVVSGSYILNQKDRSKAIKSLK